MEAVIAACWGAFILTWIGGYLYNLARAPKAVRVDPGAEAWLIRLVVALALVALVSRRVVPVAILLSVSTDPVAEAFGAALLIASTALTLWARLTLGTMWTMTPTIKERHELRTGGPYRLTRHPIYTGILGMFAGTALATGLGIVVIALASFALFVSFRIRAEERLLVDTFGDGYRRYQRAVPAIVPFLR